MIPGPVLLIVNDNPEAPDGMNNREVGLLMGLDYSTVSLGRKRLGGLLEKDASLSGMMEAVKREVGTPRALAGEKGKEAAG